MFQFRHPARAYSSVVFCSVRRTSREERYLLLRWISPPRYLWLVTHYTFRITRVLAPPLPAPTTVFDRLKSFSKPCDDYTRCDICYCATAALSFSAILWVVQFCKYSPGTLVVRSDHSVVSVSSGRSSTLESRCNRSSRWKRCSRAIVEGEKQ